MEGRDEPPDPSARAAFAGRDARGKFAELLRRAEQGMRTRLTRRGRPIAYLVPLADGERLKALDEAERAGDPDSGDLPAWSPYDDGPPDDDDDDDLPPELGPPPGMIEGFPEGMPPEEPSYFMPEALLPDHDEDERAAIIADFRKGLTRIFSDTDKLSNAGWGGVIQLSF